MVSGDIVDLGRNLMQHDTVANQVRPCLEEFRLFLEQSRQVDVKADLG